MTEITFPLAFIAGFMSFLSPCVLPLVPVYISFISGLSIEEIRQSKSMPKTFLSTIAFISGFSTIFVILGASSSFLGSLLLEYQSYIRTVGAILTILFGLFFTGILRLDFLMRERRFHIHKGPTGYIGAFLIGISFAAGWTPCIGPILGTILIYASSQASASFGLQLLGAYSAGLAIPFLVTTFAINAFFTYTRKLDKFIKIITITSGLVLIAFGILLLTDKLGYLASFFPDLGVKF